MPSRYLSNVLDLYKWKLSGNEKLKDRECSTLISKDSTMKLWIDKRTYLLLQMQEKADLGGGMSTLKVAQFTPTLNSKVEDREFKGPKKATPPAASDEPDASTVALWRLNALTSQGFKLSRGR